MTTLKERKLRTAIEHFGIDVLARGTVHKLLIEDLVKVFKKEMERIIGEKEELLPNMGDPEISDVYTRNQLRAELRERVRGI